MIQRQTCCLRKEMPVELAVGKLYDRKRDVMEVTRNEEVKGRWRALCGGGEGPWCVCVKTSKSIPTVGLEPRPQD